MEKLKKQIGDRELEIDDLVKKSREDLWKADLDEFIKEWRFQLEDEDRRRKKVMKMGRRASQKLRIGAAGPTSRKRKANGHGFDDDDFGVSKAAKKTAAVKQPKPRGGLLSEPLAKANQPKPRGPKPKAAATKAAPEVKPEAKAPDDIWMNVDASPSEAPVAPIFQKAKAAAAPFKSAPAKEAMSEDEDDDDEEEVVRKPVARRARAAASKPVSYELDSESDDNGDDLLFDVGKMVKGINGTSTESAGRPLFSTASSLPRPGSSHGLPKKPASRRETSFDGADDTDYSKLAPPTTKKGSAVTAKHTVLSDEEDDSFGAMMATAAAAKPTAPAKPMPKPAAASKVSKAQVSKPSKPTAKAKAKATVKDALAVSAAPPPLRKLPLSPAAKAYAAKQAKKPKKVLDDSDDDDEEDEVEKTLNEIISDDEVEETGGGVAARRPARRAAAAAATTGKKAWVVESGSDEEEDQEDEEESAMFDAEDSDDF